MALAIEIIEEIGEEMAAWDLPESLSEDPNVRLRSSGDFSGLTSDERSRVNFGVTEAARVIRGARPGFGYTVETRTENVYSVVHRGVGGQAPVEGLVIIRGPIYTPEVTLFKAKRI